MFWRKQRREAEAELASAKQADESSKESLGEARDSYRDALRVARVARAANERNHFSERLNEAYGG